MKHEKDETVNNMEKFLTNEIFETIFELNKSDIFDHYDITKTNDNKYNVKYCFKKGIICKDQHHYIDLKFKTIRKVDKNKTKFYIVGEDNNQNNENTCYYLSNYTKLEIENLILFFIHKIKRNGKTSIKIDYAMNCCYKKISGIILENFKQIIEKIIERIKLYLYF